MKSSKLVVYLRVSTTKQGIDGLGIAAQRASCESYAAQNHLEIVKTYTEVESGRVNARPQLAAALGYCRRSGSRLVIARIDRLARNLKFILTVLESGIEVTAADMPSAGTLVFSIMGAVAQAECAATSDRTKVALQAAKARGTLLGTHNGKTPPLTAEARSKGQKVSAERNRLRSLADYADVIPLIQSMRASGSTAQAIADTLNEQGHQTRQSCKWGTTQVYKLLARAG
jgi:DNA invertase Pin-like site-specific DNA recombinase